MQTRHLSYKYFYIGLAVLLILSLIISARIGAVNISYNKIFSYLFQSQEDSIERSLFLKIRLPRVILCGFVGAALSVSGALMQALFRNPIVEPGLVGTSSGAAFGAAFVFVMGKTLSGPLVDFIG